MHILKLFWQHRQALKAYLTHQPWQVESILAVDLGRLHDIQAVLLDFDGVLAAHGEIEPRPEVQVWLREALKYFPDGLYLFSNLPLPERIAWFTQHFPEIHFLRDFPKKPNIQAIRHVLQRHGLVPQQVLIIDDRLATGVLAAVCAGIKAYWVTSPYINWRKRPLKEGFFVFLRCLERLCLRIL